MGIGWQQILIVAVLAILLFGRGKISELMGDVAKGIKSFRKGLAEDEPAPPKAIDKGQTIDAEAKKDNTTVS